MLDKYKEKLKKTSEVYLRIKVIPGADQTAVKDIMSDDTIKIAISAPPEKDKANKELIKFLAKFFVISKSSIKIISGPKERLKLIKIFK